MKQYLGLWFDENGSPQIALRPEPSELLNQSGGRVSPLFHAAGLQVAALPDHGALAFMYATSPRALLAALARAESRGTLEGASVYVSHGLAAVVVVLEEAHRVDPWLERWADYLVAQDIWLVAEGTLISEAFMLRARREEVDSCPSLELPTCSLPSEVEVELDQFQTNLRLFWSRCRSFAPELVELGTSLVDAVETTLETISENLEATGTAGRYTPTHYACVANLVEINSCLTLLLSQAFSCAGPVSRGFFSVGEYSLLGIGSVVRGAWRMYEHVSNVFAQENHLERLTLLAKEAPFDSAHLNPYAFDYDTWRDSGLDMYAAANDEPSRKHVVYFSSRWGFHQTMQSVSISWQCISSGASMEWNLLTFSHEFLHAHLRELLDLLLLDPSVPTPDLVDLFNRGEAENWGESATQFLISQLRWISKAEVLNLGTLLGAASGTRAERVRQRIDAVELDSLVTEQLRFLEEIATHVMDYTYFYDSKDAIYISSLWHSWSLVPNVQPQLDVYILRSLLALGSMYPKLDAQAAFDDACTRLSNAFRDILDVEEHGLIREALDILEDPDLASQLKGIGTRFQASFLLVLFVRRYLISENVHTMLFFDSQADDEGNYPAQPGSYPTGRIESPIGFLVNRFASYDSSRRREDVEHESLWQYLTIL